MNREGDSGWKPGCGCIALALVLSILLIILLLRAAFWFDPDGTGAGFLGATIVLSLVLFPGVIVVIGLVVGWIWAPFAALVCAQVARAQGLDSRRFAAAGAIYSILFFWPWVYLVLRMHGKSVPSPVIRGAYIVLYAVIWPASALSFILTAFFSRTGRSLRSCCCSAPSRGFFQRESCPHGTSVTATSRVIRRKMCCPIVLT